MAIVNSVERFALDRVLCIYATTARSGTSSVWGLWGDQRTLCEDLVRERSTYNSCVTMRLTCFILPCPNNPGYLIMAVAVTIIF